jgi:hypothetical protein
MIMVRRPSHEIYGRENEDKAWWAPKRYGYGAGLPLAWQGWAVTIAYLLFVTGSALAVLPHSVTAFVALVIGATLAFVIVVARHTRGGFRWRAGED